MDDTRPADDTAAFRHAFRRHAAGVVAITTVLPDGTPAGFTATSVASLAADPPLVTFNMARTASTWPAVAEGTHVIVHMLGARNRTAAERLAGPAGRRFEGDHWTPGPLGIPLLRDVTAWMLVRIVDRVAVASAAVVVAQVEDGGLGEPDVPLIYHERQYWRPGDPA
ncbi:flavin reductase (DIM6/NTAB) family NADH-FMN oxidoreductase RutF [Diaminobutyricimonas aerilata]|uniref:Flavin reductase (DIM6/NTAB) family NADH-FMN oxidoreductase RutF n=1 Tax=Diaminobutyricimonas aerilata TaxID=1162967 RepID=A0A2M9CKE8_9MICO|nr:flavin reductase family protein [Diaminobutyricimonas aerilata]PJJ72375.1 flavin reductase (DIM6/NTAB) family NADH-FMN oxidoreductase RutF [Diaminobutyricimonas aerilata]